MASIQKVKAHSLFKVNNNSTALIRRFISGYLSVHKKNLAIATLCMVVSSACYGYFTHTLSPLFKTILSTTDNAQLFGFVAMLIGLFLVKGITEFVYNFLMEKIGLNTVAKIQNEMFSKIVHQDLYFFRNHPAASLASRFLFDLQRLRQTISQTVTGSVRDTSMVIALLFNLFSKDWMLSLFVLLVFPPVILMTRRFGKRTRKYSGGIQQGTASLSSVLNETFGGIRQVHVYTMEEKEKTRARDSIFTILNLMIKSARVRAMTSPLVEFVAMVNFSVVIVLAVYRVRGGALDPADFLSFLATLLLMYRPLKGLSNINNSIQEGLAVLDRTFEVLDAKTHIHDKAGAEKLTAKKGEITFHHTTFKYPDGNHAIDSLNLVIPAGKTVALVGSSGAGKSTILNMIPRFYDPTSGSVTIDGQTIKDCTLTSLRQHISLVTQDVVLFNDSIYNNIAYGNADASKEEIESAAKAAAAHDFITKMDDGYQTVVGENGGRLSGGQRQRIAIARALLKNAPILLLDEATSSLDTESERQVQKALKHLMKGRTTLVVAHRLSTVVDADVIHVLDQGKIVESGTHTQLLDKDGAYANLYQMQSSEH